MLYTSFVCCECAPCIFLLPANSFLQRINIFSVRQNTSDPVSTRKSMGPIFPPLSASTFPLILKNSPTAFSSSKMQQRPTATTQSFFTFSPNSKTKGFKLKVATRARLPYLLYLWLVHLYLLGRPSVLFTLFLYNHIMKGVNVMGSWVYPKPITICRTAHAYHDFTMLWSP